MPKDKTLSHIKVNKAIKEEFLEKGFEAASIRGIGARAGMTSAGLYRHYTSKEAMFSAMVDPLINDIKEWTKKHTEKKQKMLDGDFDEEELFDESFVDLINMVILPKRDEFKLLMTCSRGTKYENFIRDYVSDGQMIFHDAIKRMREKRCIDKEIEEEELHVLFSAYITACFEIIMYDCNRDKIKKYLNALHDFFYAWSKMMGFN